MSSTTTLKCRFFECQKCSEKFTRKFNLLRHIERVHDKSDEIVKQQNNHYTQQNNHYMQQNNHYDKIPPHSASEKECPSCKKTFAANWRLVRHIEKCKGDKRRFECENCLKQFTHERSRFNHYKICAVKKAPQTIINNTTNINAETYIENQTTNNNVIIIYGKQPFTRDHLTKEDLQKIVQHIDSRAMTEYSKQIFSNKENRCVKKTNVKLNHSQIYTGDNKWEIELDSVIYPKLASDMASDMYEYLHTKRNQLRKEVFEKITNFVDYMADKGYVNTEESERKKIIQAEYKTFVNGLKLIVYGISKE